MVITQPPGWERIAGEIARGARRPDRVREPEAPIPVKVAAGRVTFGRT